MIKIAGNMTHRSIINNPLQYVHTGSRNPWENRKYGFQIPTINTWLVSPPNNIPGNPHFAPHTIATLKFIIISASGAQISENIPYPNRNCITPPRV